MPRFLIRRSSGVVLWFAAVAAALAAALASPVSADVVIIEPPPLIRKFPESFCPLPITMTFQATGTYATFHAEANVYVDVSGTLTYTNQALDNMALVPTSVHMANFVPNVAYDLCYEQSPVDSIFLFDQVNPASVPLLETFESGAPNWDLSQGAYHDNTRSADLDPSASIHHQGVACLGIGQPTTIPSLSDVGRTSITVNGLTPGQSYTVSGWWIVGDGIFTQQATLRLKITGPSLNSPPDVSGAVACEPVLSPANHQYRAASICGVTDPDGDPVTLTVTGITQDEPPNARSDGNTCPDAQIVQGQAAVRAERAAGSQGNGRVYAISFTASDGQGGTSAGTIHVCVPRGNRDNPCVDDGQQYNSLAACSGAAQLALEGASLDVGRDGAARATVTFDLPADGPVELAFFDVAGRRLGTIEHGVLTRGAYERTWDLSGLAKGLYFVRLRVGNETLSRPVLKAD